MELTCFYAAPGRILVTADVWTTDSMKVGFLGVMAHWIGVKDKIWTLKSSLD